MRRVALLVSCILVLTAINWSIWQRERLLRAGRVVLLELAPVDPRSLMQGDYMALRFDLERRAFSGLNQDELPDGLLVVALDGNRLATFRRLYGDGPLAPEELLLRYRVRNGRVKFATNAYFFQEGTAERYSAAKYGAMRVADDGEMLLTCLRDEKFRVLGK